MSALSVLSAALITAGILFMAISVIGLVRLPDVFARAHAVAKSETFGLVLVFTGLLLRPEVDAPAAVRLALILAFSIAANPTGVHALIRAGFRSGLRPFAVADPSDTGPEDRR